MSTAKTALIEFEKNCDEHIEKLSIWKLPLRTTLSYLFLIADNDFVGGRFKNKRTPNPERLSNILIRMSYLFPYFGNSDAAIGADLNNALNALQKDHYGQLTEILGYAHFSEIMQQYHRGYYRIDVREKEFMFTHANEAISRFEVKDILAVEMSLMRYVREPKYDMLRITKMAFEWPKLDPNDLTHVLDQGYKNFLSGTKEECLLPNDGFEQVLKFSNTEFLKVRAAMASFAHWCLGMSFANETLAQKFKSKDEFYQSECLEWAVPLLEKDFVETTLVDICGVDLTKVKSILNFFTDAPLNRDTNLKTGEGFTTPFIEIENSYLIGLSAVFTMMPERNLLYLLNKTNSDFFDKSVSHMLEPKLIDQACAALSKLKNATILKNINWEVEDTKSEIDMLIYCPDTNSALQLQAKAAIPPSGARMTRQIETNTIKAVDQLISFESLPSTSQDRIISEALGFKVSDVDIASGVLSRSSFGTAKAWAAIGDRAALNLSILEIIVACPLSYNSAQWHFD